MILPVIPERALEELGRTEGGAESLGLLVRDQHTRRLLLLRAVLDAVESADPAICPADAKARLREDWALLEEADRAERGLRGGAGGGTYEGSALPYDLGADLGTNLGTGFGTALGTNHGVGRDAGSGVRSGDRRGRVAPGGPASPAGPAGPARLTGSTGPASEPAPTGDEGSPSGDQGSPRAVTEPVRLGVPVVTPPGAGPEQAAHHGAVAPPGTYEGPVPVAVAAGGHPLTPVRALLLQPFIGPWARHCLRGLGGAAAGDARELGRDLAYFGALAAVAAARAGVSYAARLTARDGVLTLPSLGALRTAAPGDVPVDAVHRQGALRLRQPGEADIVVRLQSGGVGAWSESAAWTPAHALPGLLPGSAPVPLDDLDPYRTPRDAPGHHTLSGPVTLDDAERKRWLQSWSGIASVLRLGGEHRVTEAAVLLRCLVPLSAPPGSTPGGRTTGSCSGTRRETFGAVLSSTPPTPTTFAATLVHELQHTKLAALSDMLTLHHAGGQPRYFAPWRPDPRPYDGLLQGAYSHLALADFFQRRALALTHPAHRDTAWAQHARYREQVGAVLPVLVGSGDLTVQGRRLVDQMVVVYERLAEHPAPRGQAARAQAYVRAARALWTQRHAPTD